MGTMIVLAVLGLILAGPFGLIVGVLIGGFAMVATRAGK